MPDAHEPPGDAAQMVQLRELLGDRFQVDLRSARLAQSVVELGDVDADASRSAPRGRLGGQPRGIARGPRPLAVAGESSFEEIAASIDQFEEPSAVGMGQFPRAVAVLGQNIFNAVGRFGNGGLLDDAGRALQRMGVAQQAAQDVRVEASSPTRGRHVRVGRSGRGPRVESSVGVLGIRQAANWGCTRRESPWTTDSSETVCKVCVQLASVSLAALGHVGDRDVHLFDRGRLLLGGELNLPRCLGGGRYQVDDLLKAAATSSNWRVPASTAFEPVSVDITVVFTAVRKSSISEISLVEPADPIGQLPDFVGDDSEPPARFAPRRPLRSRR